MTPYVTQFGKSTTLSADMTIGETSSATLASSAFTNFVGDYLVLDYNIPAKREVIKCTTTGTALSSMTRGQEGTSAIAHSSGALVCYAFVPAHYAFLENQPKCKVTMTSAQGVANSTQTLLTFNLESYDTDVMHDTSTNNSRITIVTPGNYSFSFNGTITGAAGGSQRVTNFYVNGATAYGGSILAPTGGNTLYMSGSYESTFIAGDYVELRAFQDSGGSLNFDFQFQCHRNGV